MAKSRKSDGGSAFLRRGNKPASLDHWVGPHQHTASGVATDPEHPDVPMGRLATTQYREEPDEIKVKR